MRSTTVLVGLMVVLLVGGWLFMRREAPRSSDEGSARGSIARTAGVVPDSPKPGHAPPVATKKPPRAGARQEREAMRRRVLDALEARERAAAERDDGSSTGAEGSPAPPDGVTSPTGPDDEPAAGNLSDRTGDHGYLLKVMNDDLMPLADECYALARETQPELAGMLVLDFEIIGDEDIGGVVETVDPGQNNELLDPGLIECMRESILSTTLPPPPKGGRDALSLSLRLEPDEG